MKSKLDIQQLFSKKYSVEEKDIYVAHISLDSSGFNKRKTRVVDAVVLMNNRMLLYRQQEISIDKSSMFKKTDWETSYADKILWEIENPDFEKLQLHIEWNYYVEYFFKYLNVKYPVAKWERSEDGSNDPFGISRLLAEELRIKLVEKGAKVYFDGILDEKASTRTLVSSIKSNHEKIKWLNDNKIDYSLNKEGKIQTISIFSTKQLDISPLLEMESLENLDLWIIKNNVDVTVIRQLNYLKSLKLCNVGSNSLTFLEDFKNLESLELSNNLIIDELKSIGKLTKLKSLVIQSSEVKDLDFAVDLRNLECLEIEGKNLTDISMIRFMPSIKKLSFANSCLVSTKPIISLNLLTDLKIIDTLATDFDCLSELTSLIKLEISSSKIKNIDFLKPLRNLKKLTLNCSGIEDISPLQHLSNMENLDLINCRSIKQGCSLDMPKLKVISVPDSIDVVSLSLEPDTDIILPEDNTTL